MIPVPIIYLFARKVLIWGADKPVIGKFFSFCLEKGEKGGKKLQEKAVLMVRDRIGGISTGEKTGRAA